MRETEIDPKQAKGVKFVSFKKDKSHPKLYFKITIGSKTIFQRSQ